MFFKIIMFLCTWHRISVNIIFLYKYSEVCFNECRKSRRNRDKGREDGKWGTWLLGGGYCRPWRFPNLVADGWVFLAFGSRKSRDVCRCTYNCICANSINDASMLSEWHFQQQQQQPISATETVRGPCSPQPCDSCIWTKPFAPPFNDNMLILAPKAPGAQRRLPIAGFCTLQSTHQSGKECMPTVWKTEIVDPNQNLLTKYV